MIPYWSTFSPQRAKERWGEREGTRERGGGFLLFIGKYRYNLRTDLAWPLIHTSIHYWQDFFYHIRSRQIQGQGQGKVHLAWQPPPHHLGYGKVLPCKKKPPAASTGKKLHSSPPLALSVSAYPQAHWTIWRKDQMAFSCCSRRPLLVFW